MKPSKEEFIDIMDWCIKNQVKVANKENWEYGKYTISSTPYFYSPEKIFELYTGQRK